MRLLHACTLALLAAAVPAQAPSPSPTTPPPAADALVAAKQRLRLSLEKAGALRDTAFAAQWGPDTKKGDEADPMVAMILGGPSGKGKVTGSWHQDRVHLAFDGDEGDELVLVGRRMLAKDGKSEWRLRGNRFADGNETGFLPDVPLLLQLLAGWDLAVTQREVGAKDDRPIEILSVTLSPEQVAEAVWSGAVPESLVQSLGGVMAFRMVGGIGGGGGRPAATAPTATVDLAIQLDPATSVIHQLHLRSWVEDGAMPGAMGAVRVFRAGAAVRVVGGGDDDEKDAADAEQEQPEPDANAPLRYEQGLPLRSRKKTSVNDYRIDLREHGQRTAPALDALQQKLLGR
jgi:hypothetical protein